MPLLSKKPGNLFLFRFLSISIFPCEMSLLSRRPGNLFLSIFPAKCPSSPRTPGKACPINAVIVE
jgi:hypothetical protein